MEVLYELVKKEKVPINIYTILVYEKIQSIKYCDAISFCKSKKLNKELIFECLTLYMIPMIYG